MTSKAPASTPITVNSEMPLQRVWQAHWLLSEAACSYSTTEQHPTVSCWDGLGKGVGLWIYFSSAQGCSLGLASPRVADVREEAEMLPRNWSKTPAEVKVFNDI